MEKASKLEKKLRILFDQNVAANLKPFLLPALVSLPKDFGWGTLKNGQLLKAAEKEGFDLLLTCDKSMKKHERVSGRKIAVLEFEPQPWRRLQHCIAYLKEAIERIKPGEYKQIDLESRLAQELRQIRKRKL